METIASVLRRLAPSPGDAVVVGGVGLTVPFLAGADGTAPSLINMAIAAAASAATGLIVKAAVAGAGAYLRAKARRMRSDDDPKNDDVADAVDAVADKLDPEGKKPAPEVTQKIERKP